MSNENKNNYEIQNSINIEDEINSNEENENNSNEENENIEEIKEVEKTNQEENIPNQNNSLKTSPLIINKNKRKRNIENLRPFRNSYKPGFENTILEDPENDTINQFEDVNLKFFDKIRNKLHKGTIYHTVTILFINSPIIIILYVIHIFAKSLFCGTIGLILVAIFSNYTTNIILFLKIQTNDDDLQKILKSNFNKFVYMIYLISDLFYNFSLGLINANISFNCIEIFIQYMWKKEGNNNNRIYIQSGLVIFFQILISIIKENLKNIINLCLIIFFQIIFIFIIIIKDNNNKNIFFTNFFDEAKLFFVLFPILFLCMANHNIILDECKNMKIFTLNRGKKVVKITIIFQLLLYLIYGALLFFKVIDENLKKNNPILWLIGNIPEKSFLNDIFILFILLIFIFCSFNSSIYLKISINNNLIKGGIKEKIILYSLIIIYNVINCLLDGTDEKILHLIISISSFFCLISCYIIPIYTYLNINKSISKFDKIKNHIVAIVLLFFGIFQFIFLFLQ